MFPPATFRSALGRVNHDLRNPFGLGGLAVRFLERLLAVPYGAGPRELALMLAAVLGMIIATVAGMI